MCTDIVTWPTEFVDLKRLDMLLKCGICYDYINTCMMTSCYHNYCSLCIRKFMQYKSKCPTCYEETYEAGLRNNKLIDEVVIVYLRMRDKLMRALRVASAASSPLPTTPTHNIKPVVPPSSLVSTSAANPLASSSPPVPSGRPKEIGVASGKLSSQSRKQPIKKGGVSCSLFPPIQHSNTVSTEITKIAEDETDVITRVVPQMFLSPKTKTESSSSPLRVSGNTSAGSGATADLSVCPVCDVQIPTRNINIHLDACLIKSKEMDAPKPKVNKVNKRDPLPKKLYNLMSDKYLKKTLKEYGLSTLGDRKALVSRLQRFTVLYNSENDSDKPRPVAELLLQVEREEREEKRPTSSIMSSFQRITGGGKPSIQFSERLNKEYLENNKDSFKMLIENMRQREGRNIRPTKPGQRIESDAEDDIDIRPIVDQVQDPQPSTSSSFDSSKISPKENTLTDLKKTECLVQDEGLENCDNNIKPGRNKNELGRIASDQKINDQEDLEITLIDDQDEEKENVDHHELISCISSGIQDDGAEYSSVFSNDNTTTGIECDESSSDSVFEFTNGGSAKKNGVVSSTPQNKNKKWMKKLSKFPTTQNCEDVTEVGEKASPVGIATSASLLASPQMFSDTECHDSTIDVSQNHLLVDEGEEKTDEKSSGGLSLNETLCGNVCEKESGGMLENRKELNRKRKTAEPLTEGEPQPEDEEEVINRRRSLRKRTRNAKYTETVQ